MKKISRILMGVVFVAVLLSSLILTVPASAGAQSFSKAAEPSDQNGICAYGTVIYDFAVAQSNPNVIYACTSDNETLKSIDQGRTWAEVNISVVGQTVGVSLVAVAQDDANVVAFATNNPVAGVPGPSVYISFDGGTHFYNMGTPNNAAHGNSVLTINDIDISKTTTDLYGFTYRYLGVAGITSSDTDATATVGTAGFYYCQVVAGGIGSVWKEAVEDFTGGPAPAYTTTPPVADASNGYLDNDYSFFAVKFSPDFGNDNVAYLLSQNGSSVSGNGSVELHVASFNLPDNLGKWDSHCSSFQWYNGWGTTPYAYGGTLVCALSNYAQKGQIIFDPNYSGIAYSPYSRTAYCSVADGLGGGAFRITEDTTARPRIATCIGGPIWSIALSTAGDVFLAANQLNTTVYKFTAATVWGAVGYPDGSTLPIKQIGGGFGYQGGLSDSSVGGYSRTTIYFAGANVVAAKQGIAGAFSLSTDNAYTFNDISLVNTWTSEILDKAVKADGTQRYVVSVDESVTDSSTFVSVWYWDSTYWSRVFVRYNATEATKVATPSPLPVGAPGTYISGYQYIIRASPVSFSTVYLGDTSAAITANGEIYYTGTSGKQDWRPRQAPRSPTTLVDMEVVDDANLYVAVNLAGIGGCVCPLTHSDLSWNASDYIQVFGAATSIASIYLVDAQSVIAGSVLGDVAYTTTGGNTPGEWATIPVKVGSAGYTYATATSLATGSIIYAVEQSVGGGDSTVWAYAVGSSASAWAPAYTSHTFVGGLANCRDVFIYKTCLYVITTGNYTAPEGNGVELARAFVSDANLGFMLGLGVYNWGFKAVTYTDVFLGDGEVWWFAPNILKGSDDASMSTATLKYPQIWFINTDSDPKYTSQMKSWGDWKSPTMFNIIFTDGLAVTKPTLTSPVDKYIVQVNKETGKAYDVTLIWTSASWASTDILEVASDPAFTIIKLEIVGAASPFEIGPYGDEVVVGDGLNHGAVLHYQPGEIYYWRVIGDAFYSLPSDVRELDIQSAPIPVPVLYSPLNDAIVGTLTPSFSWSPMSGTMTADTDPTSGTTTTYTIEVGTDPAFGLFTFHSYHATNTAGFVMTDPLVDKTIYYWRVCPQVTPLTNWSSTFHFTVDLSKATTTTTVTSYSAPSNVVVPTNATNTTIDQTSPAYIWAIIIIGAVLVIAIIVLILRVRK